MKTYTPIPSRPLSQQLRNSKITRNAFISVYDENNFDTLTPPISVTPFLPFMFQHVLRECNSEDATVDTIGLLLHIFNVHRHVLGGRF